MFFLIWHWCWRICNAERKHSYFERTLKSIMLQLSITSNFINIVLASYKLNTHYLTNTIVGLQYFLFGLRKAKLILTLTWVFYGRKQVVNLNPLKGSPKCGTIISPDFLFVSFVVEICSVGKIILICWLDVVFKEY
jgi:hypothetical protein